MLSCLLLDYAYDHVCHCACYDHMPTIMHVFLPMIVICVLLCMVSCLLLDYAYEYRCCYEYYYDMHIIMHVILPMIIICLLLCLSLCMLLSYAYYYAYYIGHNSRHMIITGIMTDIIIGI